MATRAHAREAVVGLLYAYESGNSNIEKYAKDILDEKKIRNRQQEFALSLFYGVIEHLESIDKVILENIKEWDFDRIGDMEKAILRLGFYEILFCNLDRAVVINEAVELSKKFGTSKSPMFINGVLDSAKKESSTESIAVDETLMPTS